MMEPQGIPQEVISRKNSTWLYMVAVGALAAISILSVLGAIVLAWGGKSVPGEVWTVTGLALGGLVAMVGQGQQQ
mgnify:FL=1